MSAPTKRPRRLRCDDSRSAGFKAGHRHARRAAIAWLHYRAARMNDPKARDILNSAADSLADAFESAQRETPQQKNKGAWKRGMAAIRLFVRDGRLRVSFRGRRY